jgi:hypothetical protein
MERFLNRPKASFRASVVISGEVLIAPKVQMTFCHECLSGLQFLRPDGSTCAENDRNAITSEIVD